MHPIKSTRLEEKKMKKLLAAIALLALLPACATTGPALSEGEKIVIVTTERPATSGRNIYALPHYERVVIPAIKN